MLLTVSVNNGETSYATFDGVKLVDYEYASQDAVWALPQRMKAQRLHGIALVSAAPHKTDQAISFLAQASGGNIWLYGRDIRLSMDIQSDTPSDVAPDRLLAAAAAYARTRGPTLVVNVGPILTVDAVSYTGAFCGGAIALGPRTMLAALRRQTGTLSPVGLSEAPPGFGRNTGDAVRSGVFWGTVAIVEKLIAKVGGEAIGRSQLLLTGQDGEWVGKELGMRYEYVPVLALEGLALAAGKYRT